MTFALFSFFFFLHCYYENWSRALFLSFDRVLSLWPAFLGSTEGHSEHALARLLESAEYRQAIPSEL